MDCLGGLPAHLRKVSVVQPNLLELALIAAH